MEFITIEPIVLKNFKKLTLENGLLWTLVFIKKITHLRVHTPDYMKKSLKKVSHHVLSDQPLALKVESTMWKKKVGHVVLNDQPLALRVESTIQKNSWSPSVE